LAVGIWESLYGIFEFFSGHGQILLSISDPPTLLFPIQAGWRRQPAHSAH
jgi:hypothetical protein